MTRTFAGALGLIAWITTLVQGWLSGGGIDEILYRGWLCLLAFSVLGAMAGYLAEQIVDEAVRTRFAEELAAAESARSAAGQERPTA